jgi:exopolysaccharide production protein ExoQ
MYSEVNLIKKSGLFPSLPRLVERAFAIFSLLLYSGALTCFISPKNRLHVIALCVSFAITAITAFLLLKRWRIVTSYLIQDKFVLPITILIAISMFWSILPLPDTLYRPAFFMGTGILPFLQITLFAIYFATQYSLSGQFRLLGFMLCAAAFLSFVIAILLPHYGVMGSMDTLEDSLHAGSWRGAYVHKNILGNIMALAGIVFLTLGINDRRYRWLFGIGLILAIILVVLSKSKTALVLLPILILLLPIYKMLRWNGMILIPSVILTILLGGTLLSLLMTNLDVILGAIGRDTTFTGRSNIWFSISHHIKEHFWLGHGYNTFWFSVKSNFITVWSNVGALLPTSAHNGFLDLFLDLGFLGFFLYIASLAVNYIRAIRLIRLSRGDDNLLPLLLLTGITQINLSESYLVGENLLWLLYVSIAIGMANELRELSKRSEQLEKS